MCQSLHKKYLEMYNTGYIAYVEGIQNAVFDGIICRIQQATNNLQQATIYNGNQ